jgi:tetratricopeptide (TPR) repeat protein
MLTDGSESPAVANEDPSREALAKANELMERGAFAEAESVLLGAVDDIERRLGKVARELITPLYRYAHAISRQHAWNAFSSKEDEALERALDIACRIFGEESRQATGIRETLADRLMASGEPRLAAQQMQIVVRVKECIYDGKGTLLAHAINGLANMLLDAGNYTESAAAYERAFDIAGNRGEERMDFSMRFGRGRALVCAGRCSEAVPQLERALEWYLNKYGERSRMTIEVRDWLERARKGSDAAV